MFTSFNFLFIWVRHLVDILSNLVCVFILSSLEIEQLVLALFLLLDVEDKVALDFELVLGLPEDVALSVFLGVRFVDLFLSLVNVFRDFVCFFTHTCHVLVYNFHFFTNFFTSFFFDCKFVSDHLDFAKKFFVLLLQGFHLGSNLRKLLRFGNWGLQSVNMLDKLNFFRAWLKFAHLVPIL